MKIYKTIFFAFLLTLINVSDVFSETVGPPHPEVSSQTTVETNDINLPVGMPIDQHIVFLLIGAITLGIVVIHNDKIKKASV